MFVPIQTSVPGSATVLLLTARLTDAVLVTPLPVALMISGKTPTGVSAAVPMVKVDVPLPLNDEGLKLDVVFAGNPLKLKFTPPEKLPFVEIVTVNVLPPPAMTDCEPGDAAIANGFCVPTTGAVTSRLNCWLAPPV